MGIPFAATVCCEYARAGRARSDCVPLDLADELRPDRRGEHVPHPVHEHEAPVLLDQIFGTG